MLYINCSPPLSNHFRYFSIFNQPAYKMRIFGHVQTPPPPLYAFVCISVDPPPPPP